MKRVIPAFLFILILLLCLSFVIEIDQNVPTIPRINVYSNDNITVKQFMTSNDTNSVMKNRVKLQNTTNLSFSMFTHVQKRKMSTSPQQQKKCQHHFVTAYYNMGAWRHSRAEYINGVKNMAVFLSQNGCKFTLYCLGDLNDNEYNCRDFHIQHHTMYFAIEQNYSMNQAMLDLRNKSINETQKEFHRVLENMATDKKLKSRQASDILKKPIKTMKNYLMINHAKFGVLKHMATKMNDTLGCIQGACIVWIDASVGNMKKIYGKWTLNEGSSWNENASLSILRTERAVLAISDKYPKKWPTQHTTVFLHGPRVEVAGRVMIFDPHWYIHSFYAKYKKLLNSLYKSNVVTTEQAMLTLLVQTIPGIILSDPSYYRIYERFLFQGHENNRSNPNILKTQENMSICMGIIAFQGIQTLRNTLESYSQCNLFDIIQEVHILFQKIDTPKRRAWSKQIVSEFPSLNPIYEYNNIGHNAFLKLVNTCSANTSFVVIVEEDFNIQLNAADVFTQLKNSISLLNNTADGVRLRSRKNGGMPNYSLQAWKEGSLGKTHLLSHVMWNDYAELSIPQITVCARNPKTWCTLSRYGHYTNNPVMYRKIFAQKMFANVPSSHTFDKFELWLTQYWSKSNYTLAWSEGIFTHQRLDRKML